MARTRADHRRDILLALVQGRPIARIEHGLRRKGLTDAAASRAIDHALNDPQVRAARRLAIEGQKAGALLDFQTSLLQQSRFWEAIRRPMLRADCFYREHYFANRPVVFRLLRAGCRA